MRSSLRSPLPAVLLLLSTPALADSVIIGIVIDAETHKGVPDVVVTATSPALKGEQVVITDDQGHYRDPQLPPGQYTLRFEKAGFTPLERSELLLRPDRTLRVNVELQSEWHTEPPSSAEVCSGCSYMPNWTTPYLLIPSFSGMARLVFQSEPPGE